MIFAILLEPRRAGQVDGRCDMPIPQFGPDDRIIAQYLSQRRGSWGVAIMETAALPRYLMEFGDGDLRVRAIPVRSQEEGFDMARAMFASRLSGILQEDAC